MLFAQPLHMSAGIDTLGTPAITFALVIAVLGLIYLVFQARRVLAMDKGNQVMQEIAAAIQEGAAAFLNREYTFLGGFVVVVAVIIAVFLAWQTALSFILGAIASGAAGYLGMFIAVRANVRTAAAASKSLDDGLRVAFSSGSIMGMAVVSFSLLGMTILYFLFNGNILYITGFGFGASSIALFARVGGGIYTKAADVGADLVGKVEQGIPEDDPRNPAVIADNVGDNVGDVAGMGADLFESYSGSIIAAATLGAVVADGAGIVLPFLVAGVGVVAALIGTFLVRAQEGASQEDLLGVLRRAIYSASVIVLILAAGVVAYTGVGWNFLAVILVGLVAGNGIGWFTEYFTSYTEKPTQGIAEKAETGAATLLIEGLAVGMNSTLPPVLIVAVAIMLALWLGGDNGPLRRRPGRCRHAQHAGAHPGDRRLRPRRRQRRRHRGDERPARRGARPHRRARQPGQHDRGHRQRLRHRLRGADRAGAHGRLCSGRQYRDARPVELDDDPRHAGGRDAALSLCRLDDDCGRQGRL